MTPEALRKLADEQEARGHACRDAGDVEGAIAAYSQAEVSRRVADGLEARGRKALPAVSESAIVDQPVFTAEHKVAMSLAKAPKDKLAKAARAAGMSLADVARRAGVHPTLMTLARDGRRPMPLAAAEAIRDLIGIPVGFWPRLS